MLCVFGDTLTLNTETLKLKIDHTTPQTTHTTHTTHQTHTNTHLPRPPRPSLLIPFTTALHMLAITGTEAAQAVLI